MITRGHERAGAPTGRYGLLFFYFWLPVGKRVQYLLNVFDFDFDAMRCDAMVVYRTLHTRTIDKNKVDIKIAPNP